MHTPACLVLVVRSNPHADVLNLAVAAAVSACIEAALVVRPGVAVVMAMAHEPPVTAFSLAVRVDVEEVDPVLAEPPPAVDRAAVVTPPHVRARPTVLRPYAHGVRAVGVLLVRADVHVAVAGRCGAQHAIALSHDCVDEGVAELREAADARARATLR